DGKARRLTSHDMVVADAERAQGVAGIIGGADSAVQKGTTEVFLEAATWEPRSIRRTSRTLGLRTEASSRFEKGLSPALSLSAVERAAALVAELAGGTATASTDVYPGPLKPITIEVDADRIERVLGVKVELGDAAAILALDEAVTSSIGSAGETPEISLPMAAWSLVRIKNPMAENRDGLRRSLLPGLLEALAVNARQDQGGARLFELGSVFWKTTANAVDELQVLAMATHVPAGGADAAAAE